MLFKGGKIMLWTRNRCLAVSCLIVGLFASLTGGYGQVGGDNGEQGAAGMPYPSMPLIAPIGVRTGKYMDIPVASQGPPINPAKGYRLQDLGKGLYMITDNAIQSMFLIYDSGVV